MIVQAASGGRFLKVNKKKIINKMNLNLIIVFWDRWGKNSFYYGYIHKISTLSMRTNKDSLLFDMRIIVEQKYIFRYDIVNIIELQLKNKKE